VKNDLRELTREKCAEASYQVMEKGGKREDNLEHQMGEPEWRGPLPWGERFPSVKGFRINWEIKEE